MVRSEKLGDHERTYDPYVEANYHINGAIWGESASLKDDLTCSFEHYWAVRIPEFRIVQIPQSPQLLVSLITLDDSFTF